MKHSTPLLTFAEGLGWIGAICIGRLVKFSFIIGSLHAGFSGIAILSPLSGACNSVVGISLLFLSQLVTTGIHGFSFMHLLAFGVPGLCAALYWSVDTHWYRIGLPALCITLFVLHPVGFYAAPYACLWFIPMAIAAMNNQSIFGHALGSTFLAHAVGSVVWLYSANLTSAVWLGLIPVAVIERLFFASATTALYYAVHELKNFLTIKRARVA